MIKDLPPPTEAEEHRNTAEILRDLAVQTQFGKTRSELFNCAENLDRLAALAEHQREARVQTVRASLDERPEPLTRLPARDRPIAQPRRGGQCPSHDWIERFAGFIFQLLRFRYSIVLIVIGGPIVAPQCVAAYPSASRSRHSLRRNALVVDELRQGRVQTAIGVDPV